MEIFDWFGISMIDALQTLKASEAVHNRVFPSGCKPFLDIRGVSGQFCLPVGNELLPGWAGHALDFRHEDGAKREPEEEGQVVIYPVDIQRQHGVRATSAGMGLKLLVHHLNQPVCKQSAGGKAVECCGVLKA